MTDTEMKRLKDDEDLVSLMLLGGHCSRTEHTPMTRRQLLIAWKMLTLDFPHLTRNVSELDREIHRECKHP